MEIQSVFRLTDSDPSGRLLGVVIQDSGSRASTSEADRGARLCEGHELDPATAKPVPATATGRMLKLDEAAKLLRRIERQITKRPPAPPVTRRAVNVA
jgi:hypothetical protein